MQGPSPRSWEPSTSYSGLAYPSTSLQVRGGYYHAVLPYLYKVSPLGSRRLLTHARGLHSGQRQLGRKNWNCVMMCTRPCDSPLSWFPSRYSSRSAASVPSSGGMGPATRGKTKLAGENKIYPPPSSLEKRSCQRVGRTCSTEMEKRNYRRYDQ